MYYVNHDLIIFFFSLMVFIVVGFILGFFMGYTCIWSTFYGVTIDNLFRRVTGRSRSRKAICGSNLVTKLVHRLPVLVNDGNNTRTMVNVPTSDRVIGTAGGHRQSSTSEAELFPSPPPSYFQSNFISLSHYAGLESPKEGTEYVIYDSNCCTNVQCIHHAQQQQQQHHFVDHNMMTVMSPCPSMSASSSSDQIPLYQRDRDFASMPPIGSAEAEFQNDFISVFPMRHLHPHPDLE